MDSKAKLAPELANAVVLASATAAATERAFATVISFRRWPAAHVISPGCSG